MYSKGTKFSMEHSQFTLKNIYNTSKPRRAYNNNEKLQLLAINYIDVQ